MRWTKVLGVVLLALGLLTVLLRTFGTTRETHSVESAGVEIRFEKEERLPIPMWLGIGLAVAGGALILVPRRTPS
jgi:drug/metabolite transporter (DMT)-like permease